jgi:hypothetical protein
MWHDVNRVWDFKVGFVGRDGALRVSRKSYSKNWRRLIKRVDLLPDRERGPTMKRTSRGRLSEDLAGALPPSSARGMWHL